MEFFENQYYHIVNRTINEEALFKTSENYAFFLKKYRYLLNDYFDTIAYCLMPTHFHFLVKVKANDDNETRKMAESRATGEYSKEISKNIGILQSSYTQAYNKKYNRHGSLFQQHANAKHINDEEYFINLAFYIHQNPIRSKLVDKPEEWEFSSYQDYINIRNGTLPCKGLILDRFTIEDIILISNDKIKL